MCNENVLAGHVTANGLGPQLLWSVAVLLPVPLLTGTPPDTSWL
jgi:hypothetical protein